MGRCRVFSSPAWSRPSCSSPCAAQARTSIRVGIGDQSAAMFDQSAFQPAKFERVRYLVPWNVMDDTQRRLAARAYVKRARVAGMQVLLHVSTDDYRIKGGPAAVGHDVPAADRADRQLPPRAGRARLRHLGRGQPRQPADLRKPFAGRVVLPRDVPGGEAALPDVRGRRARRARPGRC
jgi:hypothetical protein